jgi:hypothetical protein
VTSAAFSADGKHIVTASRDKTARVWSAATRTSIHTLVGHAEDVIGASFSPDGKRIVTASADKTARLWDAATGEQVGGPFVGHSDTVSGAAFSADGKRIVTASWDKTARLWDNDFRTPIAVMRHPDRVLSAEFSPNGELVVTASSDGVTRIWQVFIDTNELIATARAAAPRCLTAEQREASYFLPAEPPAWCIEMAKWPYQTAAWKAWLADLRAGKKPACCTCSSAMRCGRRHAEASVLVVPKCDIGRVATELAANDKAAALPIPEMNSPHRISTLQKFCAVLSIPRRQSRRALGCFFSKSLSEPEMEHWHR